MTRLKELMENAFDNTESARNDNKFELYVSYFEYYMTIEDYKKAREMFCILLEYNKTDPKVDYHLKRLVNKYQNSI